MPEQAAVLSLPAPNVDGNLGGLPSSRVPDDTPENGEKLRANPAPAAVATHTRTIGIVHPPPDIRTIVDKTAQFVVEKGSEFERIIIHKHAANPNFNFLNASSPYNAYYRHQLSKYRARNEGPASQLPVVSPATTPAPDPALYTPPPSRQVPEVREPPEAEQYTVRLPDGITGEELDIIKLTAQFVARNGKSFLTGLMSREIGNPQFHFLKPNLSTFVFFTALADAYSKLLMPPEGLTEKLRKRVTDITTVLERCLHRLEWEKSQEQARQRAEDEIEHERVQMALIDWHDFVIVETIEFADDEDKDIPPPMTLEEVLRRSKTAKAEGEIVEPGTEVEMEMDEEFQLGDEGTRAGSIEDNNDEYDDLEPPMRIVKNWKRPEERMPAEIYPTRYVLSPITGEMIPVGEMSEHMRISLIDPKYKEQKDRMFAKVRETTLAHDEEISRNIVGLASSRPDIFGTTEEEVSNAVKAEIEKKKDEQPMQVVWDGQTGSTGGTSNEAFPGPTALPPRSAVPSVHPLFSTPRFASNLPCLPVPQPRPPGMPMMPVLQAPLPPMSMGMNPLPPPKSAPPSLPEEPERKRQKLDDSLLIPEDQFLAQHQGPARVNISVNEGGNLRGQVSAITVQSLSETVSSLKEKIARELQLPANKQKLSGKTGFLKDNFSLAYYNVGDGDILNLSLRERGGRRR